MATLLTTLIELVASYGHPTHPNPNPTPNPTPTPTPTPTPYKVAVLIGELNDVMAQFESDSNSYEGVTEVGSKSWAVSREQ